MWSDFHTLGVNVFSHKSWLVAAIRKRIASATTPNVSKGNAVSEP
jgi:hypothetical protein